MLHIRNIFMIAALVASTYSSYAADIAPYPDDPKWSGRLKKLPDFRKYFTVGSFELKDKKNIEELLFFKYSPETSNYAEITCGLVEGPKPCVDAVKGALLKQNEFLFDVPPNRSCCAIICFMPSIARRTDNSNTPKSVMEQAWKDYIEVDDDGVYSDRLKEKESFEKMISYLRINEISKKPTKKGLPGKVHARSETYVENARTTVKMNFEKHCNLVKKALEQEDFEGVYVLTSSEKCFAFLLAVKQVMGKKPTGWVIVEEAKERTIKPAKEEAS